MCCASNQLRLNSTTSLYSEEVLEYYTAQVNVLEDTIAEIFSNTAIYGGTVALLGYSILELYPKSRVGFDSNIASELGGAGYATSPHQAEFIFSHKCFISYVS